MYIPETRNSLSVFHLILKSAPMLFSTTTVALWCNTFPTCSHFFPRAFWNTGRSKDKSFLSGLQLWCPGKKKKKRWLCMMGKSKVTELAQSEGITEGAEKEKIVSHWVAPSRTFLYVVWPFFVNDCKSWVEWRKKVVPLSENPLSLIQWKVLTMLICWADVNFYSATKKDK